MGKTVAITDSEFQKSVLESTIPVVVDFWAPWCGPCRMVGPILEDLAAQYAGKILVAKVNTDENNLWAQHYGVRGIPTMLFIQNGEVKQQMVGVPQNAKATIRGEIEKMLPVVES